METKKPTTTKIEAPEHLADALSDLRRKIAELAAKKSELSEKIKRTEGVISSDKRQETILRQKLDAVELDLQKKEHQKDALEDQTKRVSDKTARIKQIKDELEEEL